jgi:hypothetical protein
MFDRGKSRERAGRHWIVAEQALIHLDRVAEKEFCLIQFAAHSEERPESGLKH